MKIEEIEIPAPWGHIAAKVWGDANNQHVIVCHGVLDNASSFDRLVPLLSDHFYYICFDLPGHGKSSFWPANMLVHATDFLLSFKVIADHFAKKRYVIMGHSFGGQLAIIFTQIYPELVSKMILIEAIHMIPNFMDYKEQTLFIFNSYFNLMEKLSNGKQPDYKYKDLLDRSVKNRVFGTITHEAYEPILKRHSELMDNGRVRLLYDQRLKFGVTPPFSLDYIDDFIRKHPIECPALIVLGDKSELRDERYKTIERRLATYKNVTIVEIDGNHSVHAVKPEAVALLINKFLLNKKNKL